MTGAGLSRSLPGRKAVPPNHPWRQAARVPRLVQGAPQMDKQESKWTYLTGWASIAVIILVMYAASKYFGF